MQFVLDTSAAGNLILPDEQSDFVNGFVSSLSKENGIVVPSLWWFEVGNVLHQAFRRERITATQISGAQQLLRRLPISTDDSSGWAYQSRLIVLARDYALTVYDAAYLELGLRFHARIVSCDSALLQACKKARAPFLSRK
jgi:predicted nucleic acid-binding protein